MNKVKNALLAIVFILPILFVITSCGDDDEDSGWTEAQESAFITACEEGDEETAGGTTEQCECMFEGISKEWTYKEYQNLGLEDIGKLAEISFGCL